MIKANELRIENILTWDGKICKVIGVSRLMFKVITLDGKRPDQDEYKDIKPIPLSPEWLERCGFEAQVIAPLTTPSMWVIRTSKGYNLYLGKRDFCFISDCDMPVELNSLHQLQNLFFALTGEELNVKP